MSGAWKWGLADVKQDGDRRVLLAKSKTGLQPRLERVWLGGSRTSTLRGDVFGGKNVRALTLPSLSRSTRPQHPKCASASAGLCWLGAGRGSRVQAGWWELESSLEKDGHLSANEAGDGECAARPGAACTAWAEVKGKAII